ncbi:DoxX family protein [Chryseobacterium arthrosphaerae]|uniref:DoxX family protein n=1 Tax=Chryseobacterium arthrosphaerae TaxID=651561 RepID=UPI000F4E825C|nr:DoxX family protein [Chryseobacterium arthrosphaerae]AYZ11560.1 DoxX family protein [Chryseobacterium arthrosphaerae]
MNKAIKQWIVSGDDTWSPLILRLTLGIVLFPHAAQKLFGWFEGPGLKGEMDYMTTHVGLSPIVAATAIAIESLGTLFLLLGAWTKITAIAVFSLFVGMIVTDHASHGSFMNWFGKMPAGAEGFEYHLLVLGICLSLMTLGGGKYSIDRSVSR